MKARSLRSLCIFIFSLMLASIPIMAWADAGQTKATPPPVTQPLTSEGILAVNLVAALGVSSTNDVIEAETALGDIGITPRNGWIADYPVTPDIVTEVRQSIATAAESKTLSYSREDALKRFDCCGGAHSIQSILPDSRRGVGAGPCQGFYGYRQQSRAPRNGLPQPWCPCVRRRHGRVDSGEPGTRLAVRLLDLVWRGDRGQ